MRKQLKIWLWGIALALSTLQMQAQSQSDTLKMSLEQCVEYALKNNLTLQNSTLDEQLAGAKIGEVRASGLPQISGSIAAQHNLRLRDSYFEITESNPFTSSLARDQFVKDPNTQQDILVRQGTPGKILKFPNFFQLPNSLDASITATQLLFSSSYIIGLQAAKSYRELSIKNTKATEIQVANNVSKAYYMVLVNLERLNLFNTNILRVDSLLSNTEKLAKNGFAENLDVMRIQVTLNNLITEREKFINVMLLSNILLKFQMGMPMEKNLLLTDELKSISIENEQVSFDKPNYSDRQEYNQLKVLKRLQDLDLKNNKYSRLPSLVAQANLGTFTSNKDLNFFSNSNFISSGPEKNNNFFSWQNDGMWSRYGSISVALNVPIFDGFAKSSKIQQSKINVKKAENNIKNFENTIDLQVYQSAITLKNNIEAMKSQKRNMDLANEVNIVTQKKYKAGTASNLEITTAETSLKEAQINYYSALYDALVSKIDYDQARGKITFKNQ